MVAWPSWWWIRTIVVSNNSKKRVKRAVENLELIMFTGLWSLYFGIDRAMKEFHYEKTKWSWLGISSWLYICAAHCRNSLDLVKPHTARFHQTQINRALVNVVLWSKSLKSTDLLLIKRNLTMEEILYWLWSNPFRRKDKTGFSFTPQSALEKVWNWRSFIASVVSLSPSPL